MFVLNIPWNHGPFIVQYIRNVLHFVSKVVWEYFVFTPLPYVIGTRAAAPAAQAAAKHWNRLDVTYCTRPLSLLRIFRGYIIILFSQPTFRCVFWFPLC